MRLDRLQLLGSRSALVPRLESHKKERVVSGSDEAEQAEANDAGGVPDAGSVGQDFLDIGRDGGGAFQRSAVRELQIDVDIALILIGKKA